MGRTFRRLRHGSSADFWRLWAVALVIYTVRSLETVVFGVVVYEKSGSAFLVAVISMLRLLPLGLFGAFVGTIVERFDRRLTLAGMVGLMGAVSATLCVVARSGELEVWHLAVASLVSGFGWATDNPVRRMMMGEVVGGDRMGWAMSLDVGASYASRAIGPALGGILLVAVGIEGAFLLSVLMYATALAMTLSVRARIAAAPGTETVLTRMRQGFVIVLADKRLAATMLVTVIFNVFAWPFTSMIPVIGRDRLELNAEGVGLLASIDGLGACVGALLLVLWLRPGWYAAGYVGGVAVYLVALIAFALTPGPMVAGAALLLAGLSGAVFATLQATIVYLAAPTNMRSRILGVLSVCVGTGPIGFVWLGWLADRIGADWATAITGVMGLLALAAARPLWRGT